MLDRGALLDPSHVRVGTEELVDVMLQGEGVWFVALLYFGASPSECPLTIELNYLERLSRS